MLTAVIIIILSYLLGSISFGVLIGKIWKGMDVRNYGSKSAGFTNVHRVIGTVPAIIVLVLDIAKGMIAVLVVAHINLGPVRMNPIDLEAIAGALAIVGHVFPVYFGFRGGKGIATGLGVLWSIIPLEVSLALMLFLIIVLFTRYISLGSLSASFFILLALTFEKFYLKTEVTTLLFIMIVFLTAFIFYNHRSNIKRLLNGTESKFGRKIIRTETGNKSS
jgi:acyl phosphate:glycerol-3-phosphate acyltransferase